MDSSQHVAALAEHLLDFAAASNSNDTNGEQRYTIFHEFFHVIERLRPVLISVF